MLLNVRRNLQANMSRICQTMNRQLSDEIDALNPKDIEQITTRLEDLVNTKKTLEVELSSEQELTNKLSMQLVSLRESRDKHERNAVSVVC